MVNSAAQNDSAGGQLSGLSVNTGYCAELFATNADGEVGGGQVEWWQGEPRVQTTAANPTDRLTATVQGSVNPGGEFLDYDVEYGPAESGWCTSNGATGSPSNYTQPTSLGYTDNSYHTVSVDLTGLAEGSAYCAALVVSGNSYLQASGGQVTWGQTLPDVQTMDAYSISGTTTTVQGFVNPQGEATSYQVEYDLKSSTWCQSEGASGSPSDVTAATSQGLDVASATYQPVTVTLTAVTERSAYCAEIVATNATGETGGGPPLAWTQGAPAAVSGDAWSTGDTTATAEGQVDPAGKSTTYQVLYDLSSSTWCRTNGASGSPAYATTPAALAYTDAAYHDITVTLTGLTANTPYCGRVAATNADGTNIGRENWNWGARDTYTLTVITYGPSSAADRVTSNPAGIACANQQTCHYTFPAGTQVTLTPTVAPGTAFSEFSGSPCNGQPTCTVTMDADRTLLAFFNTQYFTLSVSLAGTGSGHVTSSPTGIACGATCSSWFFYATQVTLTATPDAGSTFAGWSGPSCSGTALTCTVTVAADAAETATFSQPVAPSPPPPRPACVVPKAKGKTLAAAKAAIATAHCTVGKVTRTKSTRKNRGRVISESPKPGRHLAHGAKVALKLGK